MQNEANAVDRGYDPAVFSIMGQSHTTVEQMAGFYNSEGYRYPSSTLGIYGAATIEEFCTLVYEEAELQGVRTEVLFSQIMRETNWLRFDGAARIEQCNFGSLGASKVKPQGDTFVDVRTGLQAQALLLRYFASDEPLPDLGQSIVGETALQPQNRGSAPYLANLSEKWPSADDEYANDLVKIIKKLLDYNLLKH